MRGKFVNWLKTNAPFLFEEKMPVWFTIIVGLAAGTATYIASPMLNRRFDLDKARSAQISKSIEGLNGQIIDLSKDIRRLNDALTNKPTSAPEIRTRCYDLITEMQWRLVDLRVVLTDEEDIKAVDRLARSIRGVQDALDRAIDKSAEDKILNAMGQLGEATEIVLNRLYLKAALKAE